MITTRQCPLCKWYGERGDIADHLASKHLVIACTLSLDCFCGERYTNIGDFRDHIGKVMNQLDAHVLLGLMRDL